MKITTVGLDIAKSIFHFFAVNKAGAKVKKKVLKRSQVLPCFAQMESCVIAMEACGSAHYWARSLEALGHTVKLIAPQYVKPFLKGNKNDYNDAEAIAEAAQRPTMRFVPIKTVEQQDVQLVHRRRERLIKERTALVNQIRGQLAEYGIVIHKGVAAVRSQLPRILEDAGNDLTVLAREYFFESYESLADLDGKCRACEKKLEVINKENALCQRLDDIHGIGSVTATALYAAAGDGKEFKNGRHMSAWLGLVPGQHSSGGKNTLLGISKRGNSYLRTLLIHGARAVLMHCEGKKDRLSVWALALKERRGHNIACVAVANKLARIAWVVMAREEEYRMAV